MKAGTSVHTEDLAGLRNLAAHLGDKFIAGYIMYTGQQTLPFGGKIKAIPMDVISRKTAIKRSNQRLPFQ